MTAPSTVSCPVPAPRQTGPAPLDLFGADFVHDPHPRLAALRDRAPVHFDPGTGLWLVSRYADIRRVLRQPELFRPDNAQLAITRLSRPAMRTLSAVGFTLPPALANNGGVSHAGLRRLLNRFLHAHRITAAVPLVERIAHELLDGVLARLRVTGSCDLVPELAAQLPCRVMLALLGIPGVPPSQLAAWSDASLELFWGRPSPARQLELAELAAGYYRWLRDAVTAGGQGRGLIGALRGHLLPDGTRLDVPTAVSACYFAFIAGHSTTAQLLAIVLRTMLATPAHWRAVHDAPERAMDWADEILRREPSVTSWRRVTAAPTELAGQPLPAGAGLLLMLMGAGSDPAVFADPERLCPGRPNARQHLAFGGGRHRCPGALLARTEAAVTLRTTAARLGLDIRLADRDQPPMLGLLSFRAPLRVPVERLSNRDAVRARGGR